MTPRSPITTHVLDTSLGIPAIGISARLEYSFDEGWQAIASGATNADGRITDWLPPGPATAGSYRIEFDTQRYFHQSGTETFFPKVVIEFAITDTDRHYHVPLLLSPFGYSTYRGS